MRLAAEDAPVAINWSTKTRNSLYIYKKKYKLKKRYSCNRP
jgi:hypothetical protein